MSWNDLGGRLALLCLVVGVLLILVSGCRGPLAPTPGFGDEVRENKNAMIANPDAGVQNTEGVEGLASSTAHGVLDNYHANEKYENQEKRQKASKQSGLEF